jgi:RNA polymerase sigma factor (sigma-70 family)
VNDKTDQQLLREYAENGSEEAFAVLVRRYLDLVYSCALRMVTDRHLAEDVTQAVFTALAHNAGKLLHCGVLSGWLYRTARNQAAMAVRSEVRRHTREEEAASMHQNQDPSESKAAWEQLAPRLDDALSQLGESDRDALLLRFFERKTAREIGERLGLSEEAAQKRVTRALERLRGFIAKKGLALPSATLAGAISLQAVQAAPVGLASTVAFGATVASAGGTGTATLLKIMTLTKLKTIIVGATLVAAVSIPILQQRSLSRLRSEQAALEMQNQQLAEQDRLQTENGRLAALRLDDSEMNRLRQEHSEVMRLRGQITAASRGIEEFLKERADAKWRRSAFSSPVLHVGTQPGEPFVANGYFPAVGWGDMGFATPESTLQTALWTTRTANLHRLLDTLNATPEVRSQLGRQLKADDWKQFPWADAKGVKVEAKGGVDREGKVEYVCEFDSQSPRPLVRAHFYLVRLGDDWKLQPDIALEGPEDSQWRLVKE